MVTPTPTPGPTPTIRGPPRPLALAIEAYAERLDVAKIREAHDLAVGAHTGRRRDSGEDCVSHPVEFQELAHLEKVRRAIIRVKVVLAVERGEHFDDLDLGWV